MSRITALLLALVVTTAACTSTDDPSASPEPVQTDATDSQSASEPALTPPPGDMNDEPAEASDDELAELESLGDVEVDRNLLSVDVTIPADFFEGQSDDVIIAGAHQRGIDNVTINEDGSVTYRMSRSQHREMMTAMRVDLAQGFDELPQDFASIQQVEYNRNFTQFTLTVDRHAYENSLDGFALFAIAMGAGFYHLFDGADPDSYRVTVDTVDAATGETFDTFLIPDDWDD